MSKLKKYWYWVVGGLATIIGGLWYLLTLKSAKNKALKAKIEMADTKEKVVKLETEIDYLKNERKPIKKELKDLEEREKQLEEKKKEIKVKDLKDKQVEDYWNK